MPEYQIRIKPADRRYVAAEYHETRYARRVDAIKHLFELASIAGREIRASVYVMRHGAWYFSDNVIGRAKVAA
jgi:hypothetical protein